MKKIKWLVVALIIVFAALGAMWLVQDNPTVQELVVFGFSLGNLPFGAWLLISFFLGTVLSFLIGLPGQLAAKRRIKRLNQRAAGHA